MYFLFLQSFISTLSIYGITTRARVALRKRILTRCHIPRDSIVPRKRATEAEGEDAYFGGRQNFPTKLSSEAAIDEDDDNVSPPRTRTNFHSCACLRYERKVMVEQLRIRVYADRTTYTCRIDDLFRHGGVNFSRTFSFSAPRASS